MDRITDSACKDIREYSSRGHLVAMVTSPEYQAIAPHRTAALADSRLIATTTTATFL